MKELHNASISWLIMFIIAIILAAFGVVTNAVSTMSRNAWENKLALQDKYIHGRIDAYSIACPPGPLVYTPGCIKLFKENIDLMLTQTSDTQKALQQ
jgi:hypothetical protein